MFIQTVVEVEANVETKSEPTTPARQQHKSGCAERRYCDSCRNTTMHYQMHTFYRQRGIKQRWWECGDCGRKDEETFYMTNK